MFRNLTLALVLSMSALAAFAIPKPSEVKAAFASGNYVKAESLLKEVMQERPTAAVHYQLGQVYAAQGKHSLALNEMRQAQVLDPTLKFASSAQAFTKALGTEQTLVAPPPVVVAQQAPPVSSIADSAYSKTYSNPREVAQPMSTQHESSGGGLMILLVLVALGAVGVIVFFLMSKKAANKSLDEKAAANKEAMGTLLGFSKSLEDALLIAKTGSYNDTMKRRIMDRIQSLQVTVRNSLADVKDGKPMSASRLATIETNVNNAVDDATNGESVHAAPVAPAPEYSEQRDATTSRYAPPAPSPSFAPSPTQSIHHYPAPAPAPVIVQNSNDGLLTGVLIGSMMNSHQDRVVERTVYVDRTPAPAPAPYYAPAPAPAPAALDTSDDRNDSYEAPDTPSIDSSPASDDTY